MHIYALLAIVILSWLAACACSIAAIVLVAARRPGPGWLAAALAAAATAIGCLGFGRWSPFRFFPQLGYSWSSDSFELSIQSSWFFVAPLALGMAALLLAVWKGRRSNHAGEHKETVRR